MSLKLQTMGLEWKWLFYLFFSIMTHQSTILFSSLWLHGVSHPQSSVIPVCIVRGSVVWKYNFKNESSFWGCKFLRRVYCLFCLEIYALFDLSECLHECEINFAYQCYCVWIYISMGYFFTTILSISSSSNMLANMSQMTFLNALSRKDKLIQCGAVIKWSVFFTIDTP